MNEIVRRNLTPFAKSTFKAYSRVYSHFAGYCQQHQVHPVPANHHVLQSYIASQARSKAWLNQFQAALAVAHKAKGFDNPFLNPQISLFMRSIRRGFTGTTKQAKAFKYSDYEAIRSALPAGNPRAIRDLAIIGLMRDCLLRSSELRSLDVCDVEGDLCHVRRSKTDQEGEGAFLYVSDDVRGVLAGWKDHLAKDKGPLFRPLTRSNRVLDRRLGINAIKRILVRCCEAAGIECGYSSHSMRVGMAQDLAEDGETLLNIQVVGRWKSAAMPAYYCRKQVARKSATHNYYSKRGG